MISDKTALIDDLLKLWHTMASGETYTEGYPTECPSCRDASTSKQWHGTDVDDQGNVYQTAPEIDRTGEYQYVDAIINRIPQPHRTALQFNARNLCTNAQVWASPRLPTGEALVTMIVEARGMFAELLG